MYAKNTEKVFPLKVPEIACDFAVMKWPCFAVAGECLPLLSVYLM